MRVEENKHEQVKSGDKKRENDMGVSVWSKRGVQRLRHGIFHLIRVAKKTKLSR